MPHPFTRSLASTVASRDDIPHRDVERLRSACPLAFGCNHPATAQTLASFQTKNEAMPIYHVETIYEALAELATDYLSSRREHGIRDMSAQIQRSLSVGLAATSRPDV